MRILELHAPYFRDHWRHAHDVITVGYGGDIPYREPIEHLGDILARLPAGWRPDLILCGDDSRTFRIVGFDDPPCPTILYAVDAHHHEAWQSHLAAAFDVAYVAQRDYVPSFAHAGAIARWLPLWAPDDLPVPAAARQHAVSFVGSLDPGYHPRRGPFLAALQARVPLYVTRGAYAPVYMASRIVVNQTVKGDLNQRVFEAMRCGALLLTEQGGNGLLDLFRDREHLVTYPRGDAEAAAALARHYLEDETARARIAAAGQAAVLAAHCESHRAAAVLDAIPANRAPAPARHTALGRACVQMAEWHRVRREDPLATPDRQRACGIMQGLYEGEAERLARGGGIPEPDRTAVLGALARLRCQHRQARDLLAWVTSNGGRLEDHLCFVDVLVRQGAANDALQAAERMIAAHPDYDLAGQLLASLQALAAGTRMDGLRRGG